MRRLTVLSALILIATLISACGGATVLTGAELTQTIDARIALAEGQIEVLAGNLPTPDFDVTAGAATARALAGANVEATSLAVQTQSANETPIAAETSDTDTAASASTGGEPSSSGGGSAAGVFGESDEHDTIVKGVVTIGTPVTADFVGVFDAHNWTVQGSSGQAIRISVAPAGDGDFEIVLFDPAGQRIAEVDGGGDGATEQISRTLAANGVFTIRIRAWRIDQYTLTVSNQ